MEINRRDFKSRARELVRQNREIILLGMILVGVASGAVSVLFAFIPLIGPILGALAIMPLALGQMIMFYNITTYKTSSVNDIFSGYSKAFKAIGLYFMIGLFICLWSLLLVIPGIIASYRYSMAPFIMIENPNMGVFEIINESKRITKGSKGKLFVLDLSFIGLSILAMIPYMIGFGVCTGIFLGSEFTKDNLVLGLSILITTLIVSLVLLGILNGYMGITKCIYYLSLRKVTDIGVGEGVSADQ